MPELPEVETIRKSLLPYLKGLEVKRVVVKDPHILGGKPALEFINSLKKEVLGPPRRYGKVLFLPLQERSLVFRLGMTGQLTLRLPSRNDGKFIRHKTTGLQKTIQHAPDKHTHIILELEQGIYLQYRDVRKFGRALIVPEVTDEGIAHYFKLGLDPLTPSYSLAYLQEKLSARKAPIKAVLLDQAVLAGLGNIYVDEALFLAGINPSLAACVVSPSKVALLFLAIPKVLNQGIAHGGTTLRDYINGLGEAGANQEELFAYGRYGKPCLRCGQTMLRATIASRTTSWCPSCQP